MDKITFVALICHYGWYCYMHGLGLCPNIEPTAEQLDSTKNGVQFNLKHPDVTPEQNHENWRKHKLAEGWSWGAVKDEKLKLHPDLIPYKDLPVEECTKDFVFQEMFKKGCFLWEELFGYDYDKDDLK